MTDFITSSIEAVETLIRVPLKSRPAGRLKKRVNGGNIIILGNGPSLAETIREHKRTLQGMTAMAVNFAANTPEFRELKPQYYVLMDPHFFSDSKSSALSDLWRNINSVDWDMTLILPVQFLKSVRGRITSDTITVSGINALAAEGWKWLSHMLFNLRLGMARPRNVLIPAIMSAIWLGYDHIYIVGADHSWLEGLSVTKDNAVVSVQKHYYADTQKEQNRVEQVYKGIKLHQVLESMVIAFKSYHTINQWARRKKVCIINATPTSLIDAFERGELPQ